MVFILRHLTKDEIILEGLTTGNDAALDVKEGGIAGCGVLPSAANITKGSWLCEYKTSRIFHPSEKAAAEEEYNKNEEGCYIMDLIYPIPSQGKMCWDATRRYHQLGRYLNHTRSPNAEITKPYWARDKWRIGFVACRDIVEGDEVVWDYRVRGETWSGCRLVKGVVQKTRAMMEEEGVEYQATTDDKQHEREGG